MFGIKTAIIGGIAAVTLLAGGTALYKWQEHKSEQAMVAAIASAKAEGRKEAQNDTLVASNKALLDAITKIGVINAETSGKLADVRNENKVSRAAIQTYNVKANAETHPEIVEDWANKTVSDQFSAIEKETK